MSDSNDRKTSSELLFSDLIPTNTPGWGIRYLARASYGCFSASMVDCLNKETRESVTTDIFKGTKSETHQSLLDLFSV